MSKQNNNLKVLNIKQSTYNEITKQGLNLPELIMTQARAIMNVEILELQKALDYYKRVCNMKVYNFFTDKDIQDYKRYIKKTNIKKTNNNDRQLTEHEFRSLIIYRITNKLIQQENE